MTASPTLPAPIPRAPVTLSEPTAYPASLRRVAIIGAGVMGCQIALRLEAVGADVTVVEPDAGRRVAVDEALGAAGVRIVASTSECDGADLVIEAVPEQVALKLQVLRDAEVALEPVMLASNTSSLSIAVLQRVLHDPERFLGLHCFQPLEQTRLVEIVRGPETADATVRAAEALVTALGSYPLHARDAPGFATSRLAVAIGLEAIRTLEEGVASVADIDEGMRRGYGHPEGPLAMTDIVGLDTRLHIARVLHAQLGERFAPPQLLLDLVEAGRLGRKTGVGFYDWRDRADPAPGIGLARKETP